MISIENIEVARFFLAVALLLLSAHFFGYLFHRLKMPKVVGEIFGGIILGPTFLGYFMPEIYKRIFLGENSLLAVVYWFGLVFLMFGSGFELETKFNKRDKKTIIFIIIGSTVFPLIFGWYALSFFDAAKLIGIKNNLFALKLIIAVAIAVTSIPVVSKIFFDLGIIKTRFAKIILSIATIHDIVLWVFVAIATALVSSSEISIKNIGLHIGYSVLFFAAAIFIMPKVIEFVNNLRLNVIPKNYEVGFIIFVLLLFVVLASYLDINVVFGAFLAGIIVGFVRSQKFIKAKLHVKEFSFALFVPIYFAIVGIKLDLIHSFDAAFFIVFFIFAMVIQGTAVLLTARLLRYSWLSCINLAISMNARGGPGIVLATVAFDLGIISENFFVTLVMLSIMTSLAAGSWLRYVVGKRWNLLE